MKWFVALLLLCLTAPIGWSQEAARSPSKAQTDVLEIIVKKFKISVTEKPPGSKRLSFSVVPLSSARAGGRKILVSSVNAAFILGDQDSTNVSSVYMVPYTDFSENFGIGIKTNIWANKNKWNFPGDFRISSLTQYTYGLGGETKTSDEMTVAFDYARIYFAANRNIAKNLLIGPGIDYDRYYNVQQKSAPYTPSSFEKYGVGTGSTSFSTGITLNLLFDDRKNSINPDNGIYGNLTVRTNPTFLENQYRWTSVYADARRYYKLDPTKRKILAFWAFYWGSFGDVPYLNLPGTSLEQNQRSGRGYSGARFRGKQMLYWESEYRFDISDNGLFGGVVFANLQSFTDPITNQFTKVLPAAGIGARLKFNKESNTNVTFDFGAGKDSFSFLIGLGECF